MGLAKNGEVEIQPSAQPDAVVAVIGQMVAGVWMGKDNQTFAIEGKPGQ